MKINLDDIHNYKYVYICDFRLNKKDAIHNKFTRKILPQKVLVRHNSETNKSIRYSDYHFVELNKEGKPLNSKVISPFDNTGYGWFKGVCVNIFDNIEECINCWNDEIDKALKILKEENELAIQVFEEKTKELKSLKGDNKCQQN